VHVSRLFAAGLLALAMLAGLLVPSAPCGTGRTSAWVAVIDVFGGLICHQRPERSFSSCGRQWPVCGRCSGLYLGAAAGAVLVAFGLRRRLTVSKWRQGLLLAAAPTLLSWTVEAASGLDPGTAARFVLALPLGVMTALWLGAIARGDLR
jgi:uncharacterized membrane protein